MKKGLSLFIILSGLISLAFAGCKGCSKYLASTEEKITTPRVTYVEISPKEPEQGDVLTAEVAFKTLMKDSKDAMVEFRWYVNGKEVQVGRLNEYSTRDLFEGNEIYVKARVRDDFGMGDWLCSKAVKITVKEDMIVAGVVIEPSEAYTNTPLRAAVNYGISDPADTDIYYRWLVNGQVLFGVEEEVLDTDYYRQGDRVMAQVCTDGDFEGGTVRSSYAVRIANRVPEVISGPHFEIDENEISFWIEAEDPDDDDLFYSLVSGPPGARMDAYTGDGYFEASKAITGNINITIEIRDSYGGAVRRAGGFKLAIEEKKTGE